MKKMVLFFVLLPLLAVSAFAQESRQDISLSGAAFLPPSVVGNAVRQSATLGIGALLSYRYMLTPSSALELNYGYDQDIQKFRTPILNNRIHSRIMEISGAYVRYFTFKNFNPFLEAGVGGYIFSPIADAKTDDFYGKGTKQIGALYGGGIAYEISPSFDIRAEYRGIIVKAPSFGIGNFSTGRYYNISNPVIGIAYHF